MAVNEEKRRLVLDQLIIQNQTAVLQDFIDKAVESPEMLEPLGCQIELLQTRLAAMVTYSDILSIMCSICLDESEIDEISAMLNDHQETTPEE